MYKIKALILAADHKNTIPSCFNLTVGFVNLLEYHLKNSLIKLIETKYTKYLNDKNWLLKTFASLMHFYLKYDGVK